MLQYNTIEGKTLDLLKVLMQDDTFSRFDLAGGTSLALQIGHRKSIDLDMFSKEIFDAQRLRNYLIRQYAFTERFSGENTLIGTIDNIKVDFITHEYPDIEKAALIDGIRLYSLPDIAAMKLNAITGNGTRIKDFVDIAYLSQKYSLYQMLKFYENKYSANIFNVLKSLFYYDEINLKERVMMSEGSFNWRNIKKRLSDMKNNQHMVFNNPPSIKTNPKP